MSACTFAVVLAWASVAITSEEPDKPLHTAIDLNVGDSREVRLSDGTVAHVKLLAVTDTRDDLRSAIRESRVKVEVNGQTTMLISANYRLPTNFAGIQIDCPATRGLYLNCDPYEDSWGLDKDVRLRLWPAGSPWIEPESFAYPIKQAWFANVTQMGNEPAYVEGQDAPTGRVIYYHSGNDFGGAEGNDEVISACNGLVISTAGKTLSEYPDLPFYRQSAYDTVYVLDARGWLYRYTHLKSIDSGVRLGERIKTGQKVGLLGKEGGSGGYAHLHFDIKSRQPSGKWGTEEAYAFLWQAYLREYKPKIIAVARPHRLTWAGETVTLDGSRSWSASGQVARYEWTFGDGSFAVGPQVERMYDKPGRYSEILKVTDHEGHVGYDFAIVNVIDKKRNGEFGSGIHAASFPPFNVHPGDEVTFKVRSFRTIPSGETWDFGDGSPPVKVRSDANANPAAPDGYAETVHSFAKPGHYLVRVDHTTGDGTLLTTRLQVLVE